MLKCNECGYENNDGSKICLKCAQPLRGTRGQANYFEQYVEYNERIKDREMQVTKNVIGIIVGIIAVFIIGIICFATIKNIPVVDKRVVGSWSQYTGTDLVGYTWIIRDNGTIDMSFGKMSMAQADFKAKDGEFIMNPGDFEIRYTYIVGNSEGRDVLILRKADTGEQEYVFFRTGG